MEAKVRLENDGRLAITYWYPQTDHGITTQWIRSDESLFGVPFSRWRRHLNRAIDLSRWRGTGPGMIGGPTKLTIGATLSEKLEAGAFSDLADARRTLKRLEAELADDRIEFVGMAREQMESFIETARNFIRDATSDA
jgi:hypothetical protein